MFTKITQSYETSDFERAALHTATAVRRAADWALWVFDAVPETLVTWNRRAHERRELAGLDDRLLADIGLSPADVAREIAKPFWRA